MSNSSARCLDEQQKAQNRTPDKKITVGVIATIGQTRTDHLGTTGVTLV